MRKSISKILLTALCLTSFSFIASAQVNSISPISPFVSTTTPSPSITQRTYGQAVQLTGFADGCLSLVGKFITSSGLPCGAGGGGSGGGTWSTTTSSVPGWLLNYSNNNTDIITIGGTSTSTAKFIFDPNTSRGLIPYASTTALTVSGQANIGSLVLSNVLGLLYGGTGLTGVGASSTVMQSNGSANVYQKLSVGNFTSPNVSQWTNDSGYLTSLAGAASSTLLADNNTWTGTNKFNTPIAISSGGTGLSAVGASSTALVTNGTSAFWQKLATSQLTNDSGFLTGMAFGYPFPLVGNATSTLTQFNGGITAYASSTIGNGTRAGGLTVSGDATTTNDINVGRAVNFNTAIASTPTATGSMYWDATERAVSVNLGNTVVLQIGQESYIRVRNNTGATIPNGSAVYFSGALGNRPTVALAIASDLTKATVAGLATEDIANNTDGFITIHGIVHGLDTSAYAESTDLYLSATTPGAVTSAIPAYPNAVSFVGQVTVSNPGNGAISVELDPHHTTLSANNLRVLQSVVTGSSVSIGTSSPYAHLSVIGQYGSTTPLFDIASTTNALYATSSVFTVLGNGNVGIGTTTPRSQLSVQGNGLFSGNISAANLTATGTISASNLTLANALTIANGGTGLTATGASSTVLISNGSANFWQKLATSQLTNDSGFLTSLAGAASSTLLADNNTFTGANNFTSNTAQIIKYASSTVTSATKGYFSSNLQIATTIGTDTLTVGGSGQFTGWTNPTTGIGLELGYLAGSGDIVALNRYNSTYLPILYEALDHHWTLSGTEGMTFNTTGLGIGSTTPRQSLSVQGNALVSGNLSVANLTATGTLTLTGLTGTQCLHEVNGVVSGTGSDCGVGGGGASTTLLADNNAFSGLNKFTNVGSTTFSGGIDAARICITGTTNCLGSSSGSTALTDYYAATTTYLNAPSNFIPVATTTSINAGQTIKIEARCVPNSNVTNGVFGLAVTNPGGGTTTIDQQIYNGGNAAQITETLIGLYTATTSGPLFIAINDAAGVTLGTAAAVGCYSYGIAYHRFTPNQVVGGGGSSTGASTTLLADNNTFSGINQFTNPATTTHAGAISVGGAPTDDMLSVKGVSTSNLFEAYDSAGNSDFIITNSGRVGIGSTTPAATFAVQGNGLLSGDLTVANLLATGTLLVKGATTFSSTVSVNNRITASISSGTIYTGAFSNTGNNNNVGLAAGNIAGGYAIKALGGNNAYGTTTWITNGAPTQLALLVKGAASQTGDLTQWRDSNDNVLSVVNANGNLGIGTSSPYAALSVVGASGIVADHIVATSTATSTFGGPVIVGAPTATVRASCIEMYYHTGANSFATSSVYFNTAGVMVSEAGACKTDGVSTTTLKLGGSIND